MSAQKGRDLLLKLDALGTGVFRTVAGLRTTRLALNAQTVDITTRESAGRWRELLAGAGLRSASLNGSGLFTDAQADTDVRSIFFEGEIAPWQIILPGLGTLEGRFQLTGLEYAGEHDGTVAYDLALASAGALVFTAE